MEASIRASKALRFGLAEVQPEQPYDNAARLAHEIGDILCMVELLVEHGMVAEHEIEAGTANKRRQLMRYMQNIPEGGLWPHQQVAT